MVSKTSILLALAMVVAHAHESPEHTIERLNIHIQAQRSPASLFQRAVAYRALRQYNKATSDLNEAISQEPENLTWKLELCRVQLASQQPSKALITANQALKLAKSPADRAHIHILRAESYHLSGHPKPSLHACQLAFREVPDGKIEWFLLQSENQRQLSQHHQRIADLKTGMALHHSAVLKVHWIDALIDASDFKTALPIIDSELSDRRWKSSWLIKRAQTLQGLKRNTEAQSDLNTALTEINLRLNSKRPDPLLLADQGIAYALLGNKTEARNSLKTLKQHRAAPWITARLESLLGRVDTPVHQQP